jgi:putative ABC transport system substrate-binding protein
MTMRQNVFRLALCAMLFALCDPVQAQQAKKIPRIGYLSATSPSAEPARTDAFRQGLRELGYIEGQNIVIEWRSAEGKLERLPDLAAELVRLKVDVIFVRSTAAVQTAKNATTTVPVVSVSGDPVGLGLVASLARPGGNVTGLANLTPELAGKRLELLKEVIPRVSRVAVLWYPDTPSAALRVRETEAAASSLGIKLQLVEVREVNDFELAFSAMKKDRAGALVPLRGTLIVNQLKRIAELAAENRLPAMYDDREFTEAGGLMSYGTMLADLDRRAANYVDKILKGAKPADLPVEQPTKFELVINLKTAKQIGLTIPPNVLARADRVIR